MYAESIACPVKRNDSDNDLHQTPFYLSVSQVDFNRDRQILLFKAEDNTKTLRANHNITLHIYTNERDIE